MRRRALLAAPLAASTILPALAQAPWPNRPLRMIVPFPPGGATDILSRVAAQYLEARLGQPVVLDNRPGASGNIAVDAVAKAAPDGYSLGVGTPSNLAINPSIMGMPYDVERDLAALSLFTIIPTILCANIDAPFQDLPGLIAHVRANPGLPFAHPGPGTTQHLTCLRLAADAGLEMTAVPFRGGAPALLEVVAGRILFYVDSIGGPLQAVRDGRVRAIAVTTAQRLPQLPDVPTMAETLPGFEALSWLGFIAPRRTPAPILARLSTLLAEAGRDPETARRAAEGGAIPVGGTAEDFAAFIRLETQRWAAAARASIGSPS